MYFVRECRTNKTDTYFQKLYKLLIERVLCSLPIAENGNKVSLTNSDIRGKVYGNFVELLAGDRIVYSDKLDYYEINFNQALKLQRLDAQKQAWRNENRSTTLYDEETGDLIAAVEQAAGSFNTADASNKDCRIDLDEAINTLEPIEREIIKMYVEGVEIVDPLMSMSVAQQRELAQLLDIPRQVISAFRERRVDLTSVPSCFLDRFASMANSTVEIMFGNVTRLSPKTGLSTSYKADDRPTAQTPITFEQLLIEANVPPEKLALLMKNES